MPSLHLVLLVLAEGPDGPQVPAGTSAIWEALDDQVHICQALLVGWGPPHGGWSVRDPGTPVILHKIQPFFCRIRTVSISTLLFLYFYLKGHTGLFLTSHHEQRSLLLLKCDHVFSLVDLRLHFETPFTAIHVETGDENTTAAARCLVVSTVASQQEDTGFEFRSAHLTSRGSSVLHGFVLVSSHHQKKTMHVRHTRLGWLSVVARSVAVAQD